MPWIRKQCLWYWDGLEFGIIFEEKNPGTPIYPALVQAGVTKKLQKKSFRKKKKRGFLRKFDFVDTLISINTSMRSLITLHEAFIYFENISMNALLRSHFPRYDAVRVIFHKCSANSHSCAQDVVKSLLVENFSGHRDTKNYPDGVRLILMRRFKRSNVRTV